MEDFPTAPFPTITTLIAISKSSSWRSLRYIFHFNLSLFCETRPCRPSRARCQRRARDFGHCTLENFETLRLEKKVHGCGPPG